jgi:hypothetical protein
MANPFPFVAGSVLTAAQLNSIGESAIAYTPTITSFTLGNGTSSWAYTRVNKLVFVKGTITFGSTTSFTGFPIVTYPVTAASTYSTQQYLGNVFVLDSGTAAYGGFITNESTTTFSIGIGNASATYLSVNSISATVPMTWTTNDSLRVSFVYEAA